MARRVLQGWLAVAAIASAAACSGQLGGASGGEGASSAGVGAAQALPLRRLTREEYNHTIRDLFGDESAPGDEFAGESVGGSGFATPGIVSEVDVNRYMEAAEAVSTRATANLAKLLPCEPATGEDACARAFIERRGHRVFRRPLAASEVDDLFALYQATRADATNTFADGVRVVLAAMLQAPQFLYRWELGPQRAAREGARVRLTGSELASRLSYFLWTSTPDDQLLNAAARGELTSPDQVEREARRMLRDPKARDAISSFHLQWLHLEGVASLVKDPETYPDFDAELRAAMNAETTAFVNNVLLDGDGRLDTLLGAPFSFINEPLAKIYEVPGVEGRALRRVELDPSRRGGLLMQASVLATQANAYEGSLILRGRFVREQILCQPIGPVPPFVAPLPKAEPGSTLRQRTEVHTAAPLCSTCHALMNPIGYGFGNFDAVGAYQTKDNGQPVDAKSSIDIDGQDRPFDGPRELVDILASSEQVRRCYQTQWYRFLLRRSENGLDRASLDRVYEAFTESGNDVREMLVAMTRSDSFFYRAASAGEPE